MVTRLRAGIFGFRIPAGQDIILFSRNLETGPGAHPTSLSMDTGVLSLGINRAGRGDDHPPSCSAEINYELRYYFIML